MKRPLPWFDRSQVAQHNDDARGHWLIIDGSVYDVSEFMRAHPGGARVLQLYAGRDATQAFHRVHRDHSQVALPLAQAHIGPLRELECVTQPEHASHRAVSLLLVDALALVVEIQNALALDHTFQLTALHSRAEVSTPPRRSRYELLRGLETHARFQRESLHVLLGTSLSGLIAEIHAADAERRRQLELEQLRGAEPNTAARTCVLKLLDRFEELTEDELTTSVACFEVLDSWLVRAWKRELVRAVRALERTHAPTLALHDLPSVHNLCERLLAHVSEYVRQADALMSR